MSEQYNLLRVTYGSKLYGTSTPTSDTDDKIVYVPDLKDLLLCKKLPIYKERYDVEGNHVSNDAKMPDNGIEIEYFPLQTFVRDFVAGQTYALEVAFAYLSYGPPKHGIMYTSEKPVYDLMKELVNKFANAEVYSMVGFAMKQTFDYVKRGERLNDAKVVLEVVDEVMTMVPEDARLDSVIPAEQMLHGVLQGNEVLVLDYIAHHARLDTEVLNGGRKPQNSLKLNGRNYTDSTTLSHFREQVRKLTALYGTRSTAAAETEVDFKSLSHAVRVYQQAIELLDTGVITFPRPNAEFLLSVKQGEANLEEVKELLQKLDAEVQQKIQTSTMRKKTPELQKQAEEWLVDKLAGLYNLKHNDD